MEQVIHANTTVDAHIDTFVQDMLSEDAPGSKDPPRTVGAAWARLRGAPQEFKAMNVTVMNPYQTALADAYWVSRGVHVPPLFNAASIEFGVGYATFQDSDPYVVGAVQFEPLVLEAAARCRARLSSPETLEQFRRAVLSPSIAGKHFEYVVGDHLFQALLPEGKTMQESELVAGVTVSEEFRGEWERPKRWCGRDAYTGFDEDFYSWMNDVLDPTSEVVRVRYPENNAGPDIVVVLRDKTHRRVMLVLVQVKFAQKVDAREALDTVDPSKLHHVNRGATPGPKQGEEHVLKKYATQHRDFLARLVRDAVPVVRVLVSGAASVGVVGSELVPHVRGSGAGQHDLQLIVDDAQLTSLLGDELVQAVRVQQVAVRSGTEG